MKTNFRRLMVGILSAAAVAVMSVGFFHIDANAEKDKLTGKTAMEITAQMGKGWNLGNTFDANGGSKDDIYSQEQSWGNPKVTKELIDGVKAAGFDTIRIPVTWYRHIDKNNNYKIDDAFMARVNEVVDYAFDNDLYVILNVHHENWVNDKKLDKNYKAIGEELEAVWTQIADNFADYDQHLIFEGMNEPRAQGTSYEWTGTQDCYDAVNYLNQVFVNTIRKNGKGQNGERALMIPGYAASNSLTVLKSIEIPTVDGKQAENIIISVHCYSPYDFCLSDTQKTFNPNSTSDTADIMNTMLNLNTMFISKGIPAVMGECGATNSQDNDAARKAWFIYIGDATREAGIPALVWDNGAKGKSGGECHNYFVRKTGEMAYPELISAFIYGDIEAKMPKDMMIDFEPYKEGGTTYMAAPEDYGFSPKKMGKKAKVNHTPDAVTGFSAKASVDENFEVSLDLSKFADKRINVTLYLQAKSNASVNIGVTEGSSASEIITADVDTEWTAVTFSYKFGADQADRSLTFKGSDEFYIDDISVTMVADADACETFAGKEADMAVAEKPVIEEKTETVAPAETDTSVESGNPAVVEVQAKSGAVLPIIIVAVIIVIAAAVAVMRMRKRK